MNVNPRSYHMQRRRSSTEETRKRIVEATVELHAERGIFGTSWRDIAERADVSTATVYNHFRTLEELVPACGEWIMARTEPPSREEVETAFRGSTLLEERVASMISRFFDFYERGEPYLELDARERQLPMVEEWEAEMQATREAFAREALHELQPADALVRAVAAMLDFPVFRSFRRHGIPRAAAEESMRRMLLALIQAPGAPRR